MQEFKRIFELYIDQKFKITIFERERQEHQFIKTRFHVELLQYFFGFTSFDFIKSHLQNLLKLYHKLYLNLKTIKCINKFFRILNLGVSYK